MITMDVFQLELDIEFDVVVPNSVTKLFRNIIMSLILTASAKKDENIC